MADVAGRSVAVEEKFVKDWAKSLRNPASPIGSHPWAVAEQTKMLDQAKKCSAAFDDVVFHSNSQALIEHYSTLFRSHGMSNVRWVRIGANEDNTMRNIPGIQHVEGREYCYLRYEDEASFRKGFERLTMFDASPLPQFGGISENAGLTTPNGETFFAVSYKGDVAGWCRLVQAFADQESVQIARIEDGTLRVASRAQFPVDDCQPTFF